MFSAVETQSWKDRRRRRTSRWTIGMVLVLAALAALAYAYQRSGGRLEETVHSLVRASSEAGTTAQVKAALALSERVNAFEIDVENRGGTVTLQGTVPSEEARSLAGAIAASTRGVRAVHNELTIDPATRPDPELTRMAARVADLEIQAGVQEALLAEPAIQPATVSVQVDGGRVTLAGQVHEPAQRYRAELAVRSVQGVQGVENRLAVDEPATPADADARLARSVEFELYSTRAFDLESIQIAASHGAIGLSGNVRSLAERLLAERIAAHVEGVVMVSNELEVREAPPTGGGATP
jgi:osmotically-inducible protein OsmY